MMDELERVLYVNNLFQLYGNLLSNVQKEIILDYYEYNLSLSEIAENRNTSRSAVEDALKKGVKKLEQIEEELKINQRNNELRKLVEKIKSTSDENKKNQLLNELERMI